MQFEMKRIENMTSKTDFTMKFTVSDSYTLQTQYIYIKSWLENYSMLKPVNLSKKLTDPNPIFNGCQPRTILFNHGSLCHLKIFVEVSFISTELF